MRILIAPDKFKGSLGAEEVAERIRAGIHSALPTAEREAAPTATNHGPTRPIGGCPTSAASCFAVSRFP